MAYVTAGDPDARAHRRDPGGAGAERRRRHRSRGAVFRSARGRSGDPARLGTRAGRRRDAARALEMIAAARASITRRSCSSPTPIRCCGWGRRRSCAAAADAGVDGVLVLDLPVEEAGPLRERLVGANLDPIFLLSPDDDGRADPRAAASRPRVSLRHLAPRRHRRARRGCGRCRTAGAPHPRAVGPAARAGIRDFDARNTSREVGRWADAAVVGQRARQGDC